MEITLSHATLRGMTMVTACDSSLSIRSSVAPPAVASFTGSTVLEPVSISFRLGGVPQTLTPFAPSPAGFSLPNGALIGEEMSGVSLRAASLSLQHLDTKVEER